MKKTDQNEAARLLAKGMQQAETRRIKRICGESDEPTFNLSDLKYLYVGDNTALPTVTPVEVANLAAILLPASGSEKGACETAIRLIREAAKQIEIEKERDRQNQAGEAENEANRRLWRNLATLIQETSGGSKTFREQSEYGHLGEDCVNFPFPISMTELYRLANLKEDTGRKRLEKVCATFRQAIYEMERREAEGRGKPTPPPPTKADFEEDRNWRKESWRKKGIFKVDFLWIAEAWPELQSVLAKCRKGEARSQKKTA